MNQIKEHLLSIPTSPDKRRIRVYLPKDYEIETKSYPVVYFHDGQNIFYDDESFLKHSWRVMETLENNPELPGMIVVAIDNLDAQRLDEYSPWQFEFRGQNNLGGLGDMYAEFLVHQVKPLIEHTYRVKTQKEYTALAGSSMGAIISAYMGAAYPEHFGRLGIFSLASFILKQPFELYLKTAKMDLSQRIFIQVGTNEGDQYISQRYLDSSLDYMRLLLMKGYKVHDLHLKVMAEARHEERAWADALYDFLKFISIDW